MNSKENISLIADLTAKIILFTWRIIFWVGLAIFCFMSIFDLLPNEKWVKYIGGFILLWTLHQFVYKPVKRYFEKISTDLDDIKNYISLKDFPSQASSLFEKTDPIEYSQEKVNSNCEYPQIRKDYIEMYGYKRWITDGRELVRYFLKEKEANKKQCN